MKEEFSELLEAHKNKNKKDIEHEIGDMFFALINYARLSDIDSSEALRNASLRFEKRFNCIEDKLKEKGTTLNESNLDEMEQLWQTCKQKC